MATPSSGRHTPADENIQHAATEAIKPGNEARPDDGMEPQNPSSTSVFMNSEPIREDQVQNAVKFLSHPKVRGSPVIHRRSFLEKKGLTKEEIDEAFRRAPDPSSNTHTPVVNSGKSTEDQVLPITAQRAQIQAVNPAVIASTGIKAPSRYRWYHAIIAIGVFTVSGAGTALFVKKSLIPRLKSWIRKVVQQEDISTANNVMPKAAEEAAVSAAAAAAAVEVAKGNQELIKSIIEERKYFEGFMNLLNLQVQEIKSLSTALNNLKEIRRSDGDREDENKIIVAPQTMHNYTAGKSEHDTFSAIPESSSLSAKPLSLAPHSKSFMEIMSMVQRGDKPSNIRDINDQPPNPNQPISNPNLVPRTKPWETNNAQRSAGQVLGGSNSKLLESNVSDTFDNERYAPWWQKRNNARISEIDNNGNYDDSQSNGQITDQRVERAWVPPQPPPVMMLEAAEAIRRPKPSVSREQTLNGEAPVSGSSALETELPPSESEDAVETTGSGFNSIVIHEEA